ncbi:TraR/DksA C4-type zinc finger protein [Vibrio sp. DW001]|uniref:TraR/DksA C4-type zinc finger protein n=1 Tax=Vibrio sp. DW001 TaxID=2912315 RepID=UPI0023B19DC5|nr:TraR/DksA C4-type zinc finger protein [Vibrio sp. DW001]WED29042.1 TraR/DksA C4-type zinc finger protein [Vibrio sp. DW001]
MPDLFDHASGLETKFTEMAIARQLQRTRQNATKESEESCLGCGVQIPQPRRELVPGCEYCVECQALRE